MKPRICSPRDSGRLPGRPSAGSPSAAASPGRSRLRTGFSGARPSVRSRKCTALSAQSPGCGRPERTPGGGRAKGRAAWPARRGPSVEEADRAVGPAQSAAAGRPVRRQAAHSLPGLGPRRGFPLPASHSQARPVWRAREQESFPVTGEREVLGPARGLLPARGAARPGGRGGGWSRCGRRGRGCCHRESRPCRRTGSAPSHQHPTLGDGHADLVDHAVVRRRRPGGSRPGRSSGPGSVEAAHWSRPRRRPRTCPRNPRCRRYRRRRAGARPGTGRRTPATPGPVVQGLEEGPLGGNANLARRHRRPPTCRAARRGTLVGLGEQDREAPRSGPSAGSSAAHPGAR